MREAYIEGKQEKHNVYIIECVYRRRTSRRSVGGRCERQIICALLLCLRLCFSAIYLLQHGAIGDELHVA